jgi:putative addiction module component (TIGR02574 family)
MNQSTKKILAEVSRLSPMERAEIVELIIESFDTEPNEEITKAWVEEAERRLSEYRKGTSVTFSEKEVFDLINKVK